MDKKCSGGIYRYVSAAWLAVCGAAMVYFSVYGGRMSSLYKGKLFGIFGCFAVAVLAGISCVGGELYWLDAAAGKHDRKYAARLALVFLAGTVLQIVYTVYAAKYCRVSLLQDSLVTSGIFCVTAIAAGMPDKKVY